MNQTPNPGSDTQYNFYEVIAKNRKRHIVAKGTVISMCGRCPGGELRGIYPELLVDGYYERKAYCIQCLNRINTGEWEWT